MEKIKVGEYVRLARNQGINKIVEIEDKRYILDGDIADEYGDSTCVLEKYQVEDTVLKHSFNIKDLLEEGDIVEFRINNLSKIDISFVKLYRDARSGKSYLGVDGFNIENVIILSIMTKEQFKNGKYGVGE